MSTQRAVKFCRLCQGYREFTEGADLFIRTNFLALRDNATAEAMKALESVAREVANQYGRREIIASALNACEACDYKEPRIVNIVYKDKEGGKI